MRSLAWLLVAILGGGAVRAADVLIVADEFPAMEYLAQRLAAEEQIASRLVKQTNLPPALADFRAVIAYIHGRLAVSAERAMVDYANQGGRLIALHHSISSGKRTNQWWFPFLGVTLPPGPVEQGGYQWTEGVTLDLVNLAPDHFLTTHKANFPGQTLYRREGAGPESSVPSFTLHESEVYLNHRPPPDRTVLLGLKYADAKTGKVWMQDTAGWCRPVGRGWLVYFLPGHSVRDFQEPAYSRLVLNAVIWQP